MTFFTRQFERGEPRLLTDFLRRKLIDGNAGENVRTGGLLGMNSSKEAGGGARVVARAVA